MENQPKSIQFCRLCLENEKDNGGFLVEIFSPLINEPGKIELKEKIKVLFGLKILPNDGLPSTVCHKCLVVTENCMDFREKCLRNDEKLRLIFKVSESAEEPEAVTETAPESETNEEDEDEIITLNPNKLYESSDESANESAEEQRVVEHSVNQLTLVTSNAVNEVSKPAPKTSSDKKEIYHCRFCDVVFPDLLSGTVHEQQSHDPVNPYSCTMCPFKTNQHPTFIYHIKQDHLLDKPFLCAQCSKGFVRRTDLRKHTFVHAGIRLYSCDICNKSFTRKTNLTKHKRIHSDTTKTSKRSQNAMCPKVFHNNSDQKSKHCNQLVSRDELDIHLRAHTEVNPVLKIDMTHPPLSESQPIVFYNQPAEQVQQPAGPPIMNFYTESVPYNIMQSIQPKKEFPIMNQLLAGIGLNSNHMPPQRNFICGICSNAFFKKKDLDRHVISVHTNIKQFKCETCAKVFNRKDKLLRHEKIHATPQTIFNCSLCPAVFIRQQMLEIHSKIHQIGNGDNYKATIEPNAHENNSVTTINPPINIDAPQLLPIQNTLTPMYPMNLSMNKSFDNSMPINLSSEKVEYLPSLNKIEPITKITIDSDGDDSLQIIEDSSVMKRSLLPNLYSIFKSSSEQIRTAPDCLTERDHQMMIDVADVKPTFGQPEKSVEDLSFSSMASRIAELKQLEPLKDLPMEILNND